MVSTVRKSIQILNTLAADGDLSATDISRRLGLPKSSVHNILTTLLAERMIERNPDTGRYHLGVKLIELGHKAHTSIDVGQVARSELVRLNQVTDETVHLTLLDEEQILYADCVESSKRLRTYSVIGVLAPLHCTSVGKAILAFQPEEFIERYIDHHGLPRFTANTITDPETLHLELERIRGLGYAVDNMEHEDHIRCIGAPIRNARGQVFASISVSAPAARIPIDDMPALADDVVSAANTISERLGWHAPETEPYHASI